MFKSRNLVFLVFLAFLGFAGDGSYNIGESVESFTLKSVDDMEYSLDKMLKDSENGVVLVWQSINCPYSQACDVRYNELAAKLKEHGITFAAVNSNKTEPTGAIKAYAKKKNYSFPVLKDWNNIIADQFNAQATPQVFLIDKENKLRYRGRIDDNHKNASKVTEHTFMNVVGEFLEGKELSVTETKSIGCTLKRVK
ncbi:redoxin domain-containing protein [candidate division KSB1 bacterium]